MTIEYDSERKRSTHLESGLAVEWVRNEPPLERRTHFKLIVDGKETPFESSYDFGDRKILDEHPGISGLELSKKMSELSEKNYRAVNIDQDFNRDIFVVTWQNLVSQGLDQYRVTTCYREYKPNDGSVYMEWSCEG